MILLVFILSASYAAYRATRKCGAAFLFFLAAATAFASATGVWAERLWGPQWSWNLNHHDSGHALAALAQGIFWLLMGLSWRQREAAHRK